MPVSCGELRQEIAEQAGVLGRGGRGDGDELVLGERRAEGQPEPCRQQGSDEDAIDGAWLRLPWLFCVMASSSPATKARASGGAGAHEEAGGVGVLDQPALVQEDDLVGVAAGLAEIVRGHDDLDAALVQRRRSPPRSPASRPGRGWRSARPGTSPWARAPRRGRAPGAAARRRTAPAPAGRRDGRAPPARAPPATRSLALGARHAGDRQRIGDVGGGRAAQQHGALEDERLLRGARAPDRPRPSGCVPAVGRSSPWQSRSSRLLPAPFGPRTTVRVPASSVRRQIVDQALAAGLEADAFEPQRQRAVVGGGGRSTHRLLADLEGGRRHQPSAWRAAVWTSIRLAFTATTISSRTKPRPSARPR